MNLRTVIATATTAAVLATGGVALAGAATGSSSASPTTTPSTNTAVTTASPSAQTATPAVHRKVRVRIRRAIRRGAAEIVSKDVGIDRKTLRADLLAGQTIADIANAHGVAPQTIVNDLVTAATKKVDAAATAGLITPARAKRIDDRLPTRVAKLVNTWLPKRARTTTP